MIATYGIWKVGGVVVPLNPMYRGELEHIFADAEVKGLVVSKAAFLGRVAPMPRHCRSSSSATTGVSRSTGPRRSSRCSLTCQVPR